MQFRLTRLKTYILLVVLASGLLLVWQQGHRDTWSCNDGEVCRTSTSELFYNATLMALIVAVLCVGFELTYRFWMRRRQRRYGDAPQQFAPLPVPARIVLHLTGIAIVMLVAFSLGAHHFEQTNCTGPDFGGDCDVAGLEGALWAGVAFIAATAIAILIERYLARHRRQQRHAVRTGVSPS